MVLTAPVLLLPERFPFWVVVVSGIAVFALFPLRRMLTGHWPTDASPDRSALTLLLVFLPFSVVVSPLKTGATFVRLTSLFWSISAYFAVRAILAPSTVVEGAGKRVRSFSATVWLPVVGSLLALVCLTGLERETKFPGVGTVNMVLPNVLGTVLDLPAGISSNEAAGMLVVLLPLGVALSSHAVFGRTDRGAGVDTSAMRTSESVAVVMASIVLAAFLVITQSRAALLAGVGALCVVSMLTGREGIRLALLLGIAGVLLIAGAGFSNLVESFVYAGKLAQATFPMLLTGRLEIWSRALYAIRDFPVTGMGLGVFGPSLPSVYPLSAGSAAAADAHDLFLQTALDFGIASLPVLLFSMFAVLKMLATAARSHAPGTFERAVSAGYLGSVTALLLYSVVDTVAPGARAGAVHWIVLAVLVSACLPAVRHAGGRGRKRQWIYAAVFVAFCIGAGASGAMQDNLLRVRALHALLTEPSLRPEITQELASRESVSPSLRWFDGLIRRADADTAATMRAWTTLLRIPEDSWLSLVKAAEPSREVLARTALQMHPRDGSAYFWLAGLVARSDASQAVALYRSGLMRDPNDGVAWCALGDLLQRQDPKSAIACYIESWHHGDPGANGAFRAGAVAERMGDTLSAIRYYRLSRFESSRRQADRLEARTGRSRRNSHNHDTR